MWTKIASGGTIDALSFAAYESQIPEKSKAKIVLSLRSPALPFVGELKRQLDEKNIPENSVSASGNELSISYRKGFPWLAVIAAIIIGILVLAILIVSWQILKEVPGPMVGLILIGLSIALILVLWLVSSGKLGIGVEKK